MATKMPHVTFPEGTDLVSYLNGVPGSPTLAGEVANRLCQEAAREFERRVDRSPFLAMDATCDFVVPLERTSAGILVDLGAWTVLGAPVAVRQIPHGAAPIPLLADVDYALHPFGAGVDDYPFDHLRLLSPPPGARVQIEGTFGYCSEVAEDVWGAVLRRAAAAALRESAGPSGFARRVKAGAVEYEFEGGGSTAAWTSEFDAIVRRIRRYV